MSQWYICNGKKWAEDPRLQYYVVEHVHNIEVVMKWEKPELGNPTASVPMMEACDHHKDDQAGRDLKISMIKPSDVFHASPQALLRA